MKAGHAIMIAAGVVLIGSTGVLTMLPLPSSPDLNLTGVTPTSSQSNDSPVEDGGPLASEDPVATRDIARADLANVQDDFVRVGLRPDRTLVSPGDGQALIMVEVSANQAALTKRTPVAVALVLDTSGSMTGNKIHNARQAARSFVDSLDHGDIIHIVSFDTVARNLLSDYVIGADRSGAHRVINQLQASGATCMSCGMESAYALLQNTQPTHLRRVLLLGDGQANQGVSDRSGLGRMASNALEMFGVATATIGLGRDHDETMMVHIADNGAANYYFLHHSDYLASVLERELASLRRTVVNDLTLTLEPRGGSRLGDSANVGLRREGERLVLTVGSLAVGERRQFIVPVILPAGELDQVLSAQVTYRPVGGTYQRLDAIARLARCDDEARVTASLDQYVQEQHEVLNAAQQVLVAMEAYERGERERGRLILEQSSRNTRQRATAMGSASLAAEAEEAAGLLIELESASPRSVQERGNIMLYRGRSYEAQSGRSRADSYHQPGMYDLNVME